MATVFQLLCEGHLGISSFKCFPSSRGLMLNSILQDDKAFQRACPADTVMSSGIYINWYIQSRDDGL